MQKFSEQFIADKYQGVEIWDSHRRVIALITTALDLAYVQMKQTKIPNKGTPEEIATATQTLLDAEPIHVLAPLAAGDSKRLLELKEGTELVRIMSVLGMPKELLDSLKASTQADPIMAYLEGTYMGLLAGLMLREVGDPMDLVGQCLFSYGEAFDRFRIQAERLIKDAAEEDRKNKRPFSAASEPQWGKSDLSEDAPKSSPWPREESQKPQARDTAVAVDEDDEDDEFPC